MADIVFLIAAVVCVVSAILLVSRKNPVHSVVFMLPLFLGMTTLFVLLNATFLAAIQMIVYGGAILVVFLFVIMLINLQPEELRDDFAISSYVLSSLGAGALAATFFVFSLNGSTPGMEAAFAKPAPSLGAAAFGSIENLAIPMFREQIVPFELTSVLICVAILGAVLLSKKRV